MQHLNPQRHSGKTPIREADAAQAPPEPDATRLARLRRDRALTPAERLDKLAAMCRQADLLRRG
ncbi:MAG TPA: hypothetical protein VK506_12365 [Conexibacter sp.]|nr:hypothetical protein [Conexibacter sp.]